MYTLMYYIQGSLASHFSNGEVFIFSIRRGSICRQMTWWKLVLDVCAFRDSSLMPWEKVPKYFH